MRILFKKLEHIFVGRLTAFVLTFPLNFKIEIPSGFDPIFACGSDKVAVGSAKTISKSGNMHTAIPDVSP